MKGSVLGHNVGSNSDSPGAVEFPVNADVFQPARPIGAQTGDRNQIRAKLRAPVGVEARPLSPAPRLGRAPRDIRLDDTMPLPKEHNAAYGLVSTIVLVDVK